MTGSLRFPADLLKQAAAVFDKDGVHVAPDLQDDPFLVGVDLRYVSPKRIG